MTIRCSPGRRAGARERRAQWAVPLLGVRTGQALAEALADGYTTVMVVLAGGEAAGQRL